ncbi:MAG: nucleoside/nucleotide kinase family protein, partial [Albidovulum sp.]
TLVRLTKAYLTEDVPVAVFDRAMELSRANARLINSHTRIILVEGNYILLKEEPWARLGPHFDVTVMIECDETTLRARLRQRWADHGFDISTATEKVEGNDLPNARRVINDSNQAEFTLVKA